MSDSTGEGWGEWETLPNDGAEAWLGALLLLGSGTISVELLIWVARIVRQTIMP